MSVLYPLFVWISGVYCTLVIRAARNGVSRITRLRSTTSMLTQKPLSRRTQMKRPPSVTMNLPGVPEATDLTVRAAKALQAASGVSQGVTLTLEKNLPMGGGLGGGSSDAATTLVVLAAVPFLPKLLVDRREEETGEP